MCAYVLLLVLRSNAWKHLSSSKKDLFVLERNIRNRLCEFKQMIINK